MEADPQYYRKSHFVARGAKQDRHQGRPEWVVDRDELEGFLSTNYVASTRTFHIGLFEAVYDKTGKIPGLWYHDTNMSAVDARANNNNDARRHEMGHLFGLYDNVGGVMDKIPTRPGERGYYGDAEAWGKAWCKTITTHLQLAK
jgi:hypothetical protein